MLEQTKRAIRIMLTAGFKRSDFYARCERHSIGRHPETGRAMYEYGRVRVTMRNSERLYDLLRLADLLENGFDVNAYRFNRKGQPHLAIFPKAEGHGRVYFRDYAQSGVPHTNQISHLRFSQILRQENARRSGQLIREQYKRAYSLERKLRRELRTGGSSLGNYIRNLTCDIIEDQIMGLDARVRNVAHMSLYAAEHKEFTGWVNKDRRHQWLRARRRYNSVVTPALST